jgi:hypothetical protein
MATEAEQPAVLTPFNELPCCPELDTEPVCDVMDMRRRLTFPTSVRGEREQPIQVEVTIHTRFTRCPGPLALGDVVYTTTLLPGEKVRLATTDRRSRFSFDSESKLSYRSEQISEEQYRMTAMRALMSDQNSTDSGSSHAKDQGSWDFHGDASGSVDVIGLGVNADANAHGSHNSESTADYLREHSAHASMADNMSVEATRTAHSLSVGEVSTRAHQAGESEDHFESASREFANANQCHAVTFLFYRLNKTETIQFELVALERRVLDPAAPTPAIANAIRRTGDVATVPQEVPATHKERLDIERRARESAAAAFEPGEGPPRVVGVPITTVTRRAAIEEVDQQLMDQGLLGNDGLVSKKAQEDFGFKHRSALPTAGVIVKGCLDGCSVCEPELQRKMQLELDRMELENALLKRQTELLEKSQEYRCCPAGVEEEE